MLLLSLQTLDKAKNLKPVEKKAKSLGVKEIFIENLQEEFVRDYVFPMFRANAFMKEIIY